MVVVVRQLSNRGVSLWLVCLALAGLVLAWSGLASAAPAGEKRELKIKADRMDYDQVRKEVRLVGNVRIVSDDTVLTAAHANYHTDSQMADLNGSVTLKQPGTSLVGERMRAWFTEGKVTVSGNVRMVTDRIGSGNLRTPATLSAPQLSYRWFEGVGEASGGVKVRQGDRRAFATSAVYRRDAGMVDLHGNVRFEQGPEDWLVSDAVAINLATETVVARGQVMGRFLVDERLQEKPQAEQSAGKKTLPHPNSLEPKPPIELVETVSPAVLPGLTE